MINKVVNVLIKINFTSLTSLEYKDMTTDDCRNLVYNLLSSYYSTRTE